MSILIPTLRGGRVWLVLLGLLLSACQAGGTSPALTASLSEIEGSVSLKPPGQMDFSAAVEGAPLSELGLVRTGADGRARLDLSTGAIIRMSSVSFLELAVRADESSPARINLEAGRIFILPGGDSQGVEVETPSGVASARGAFMLVEVNPILLDVAVTCLEGRCEVVNPAGQVQLAAGQKALLLHRDLSTGGYSVPTAQPMESGDYAPWLAESPEAEALARSGLDSLPSVPAATLTPTRTPQPTPSRAPSSTPTPEMAAGSDMGPCIRLVSPAEGALVEHNNSVTFAWTSRVQASRYALELTYPDGAVVVFETTELSLSRYFDEIWESMNFSWKVSALDADGNAMCSSPTGTFIKPAAQPTREKETLPPTPKGNP
ncbi:MAG: FecR domain-containing protein [Chloroflexota bacterium]